MSFSLTLADRNVYLSLGETTLSCVIRRIPIGGRD
jgi:hypothetical protein